MENTDYTFENIPLILKRIESKLNELTDDLEKSINKKNEDEWLDLDSLIEYMPSKPKKPTIYAKVSKKLIPFHKQGKKLIFLRSEIDEWLRSGRRKTKSELEELN